MALKIAFRREHRGRTNQHNTAAQQASRACVLRLCIIQVIYLTLLPNRFSLILVLLYHIALLLLPWIITRFVNLLCSIY
jgi:hypothetical protein